MAAERVQAISELTDSLISQAEAVKRQSDDLISALDNAKGQLAHRVAPGAALAISAALRVTRLPVQQEPRLQAVETPPAEPPAVAADSALQPSGEPAAGLRGPIPASAKLLATQMAASGSSRAEIEARLRGKYGIDDADSMLDAILGEGA